MRIPENFSIKIYIGRSAKIATSLLIIPAVLVFSNFYIQRSVPVQKIGLQQGWQKLVRWCSCAGFVNFFIQNRELPYASVSRGKPCSVIFL